MIKMKYFVMTFLISIILFFIPNISNATVEYTRTFPGNDGSIIVNLTGLNLNESKSYSFALVTKGSTPTTWHNITDFTTTTASINLSSATDDIVAVLKVTDTGVLYIKDNSDDSYVLDAKEIDLKLPYLHFLLLFYFQLFPKFLHPKIHLLNIGQNILPKDLLLL